MNDVTYKKKAEPKGKWVRILLFWANWLFVVFLSKNLISPPAGNLDFVVKSIGTFFVAVVMTALMIRFFSRRVIRGLGSNLQNSIDCSWSDAILKLEGRSDKESQWKERI